MKLFCLCLLLLFIAQNVNAQEKNIPLSVAVFNNGTSLPGTGYAGVFSKTVHPGMVLGTYYTYNRRQKSELFQTGKLGYFYHAQAQHGIQLYSELGYRYHTPMGFYGEGLLGAGYLHSIPDVQQFEFKEGAYHQKKSMGRPQFMGTASLAIGYSLRRKTARPLNIYIQYQFWLQAPFVKKYVTLLPNTALHFGVSYLFPKTTKKRAAHEQ